MNRREFFKVSGAGMAGLILSPYLSGQDQTEPGDRLSEMGIKDYENIYRLSKMFKYQFGSAPDVFGDIAGTVEGVLEGNITDYDDLQLVRIRDGWGHLRDRAVTDARRKILTLAIDASLSGS